MENGCLLPLCQMAPGESHVRIGWKSVSWKVSQIVNSAIKMKNKTKNGNLRCIVPNCAESGHQDKRSMYKFPVNPVIRTKWTENIGLAKHQNLYNQRVCRRHFETQCFGKAKVFSWAVPTLFLGKNEVRHHSVPTTRKSFVRKCSVKNCPSRSPPDRLHFFPSDPRLRQEWLDTCRLTGDNKWLFICGRHFRRSLLPNRNSNLPKDCKPEFFLGLEEEDPLEEHVKSEFEPLKKLNFKSEDEGIDEEYSKESNPPKSCGNCSDLEQQLAAALLRIKELEKQQKDLPHSEEEEEDEYIIVLMK
ncbi:uncharacterized protein [Drosophila kikkawai]|uniref:Uncharacterized protein isoform X1 n=2 Tax=Drosophila kikkawai TaxID=30033 RepID=A0ABM4GKB9_DROKI